VGIRKFLDSFGVIITSALSGALIISCLAYYTSLFPLFDALSIGVPWLMGVNLVLVIFWSLRKRWILFFPLVAVLLAFYSFGTLYEVGAPEDMKEKEGLRLMTFNTRGFSDSKYRKSNTYGNDIVAFVAAEDPDILCFQEFNRFRLKDFQQYPFYFLTPRGKGKSTQVIFSKYPIIGQGQVLFQDSNNNTLYADIDYKGDTLRIYNVHLQSYQIRSRRILWRNYGQDFLKRLYSVSRKHREQARMVRSHLASSPYPSVICGDFNATSFSRPYRILSKGMQDSFREKGIGWGATYYLNQILPYRIDHILVPREYEILAHQNYDIRLSDHLPVMAILKPKGQ